MIFEGAQTCIPNVGIRQATTGGQSRNPAACRWAGIRHREAADPSAARYSDFGMVAYVVISEQATWLYLPYVC